MLPSTGAELHLQLATGAAPCTRFTAAGLRPPACAVHSSGRAGGSAARCAQQAASAPPQQPRRRPQERWRANALAAGSTSTSITQAGSLDEEEWEQMYGQSALRYGVSLEQGLRETMEDAAQVVPHGRCGFFFATVFDGHGGYAAAEYLQQNLYRIFTRVLDQQGVAEGLEFSIDVPGLACPIAFTPVLTDSFKHADEDLLSWMHANVPDEERTSGCTATTVLVRKDLVVVANVGDSRAVLSRGGRALDLSAEHRVWGKTPGVVAEIERIESVGGWVDDGRVCGVLAVSRAFGDMEFKGQEGLKMLLEKGLDFGLWDQKFADSRRFTGDPVTAQPDVTELALHDGDEFLVVASDGLWDVMDSQEVVKLARRDLQRGLDPQEVAAKMSALAVKRGSQDNVAVVVIDLGKVEWSKQGGGGFLGNLFGSRPAMAPLSASLQHSLALRPCSARATQPRGAKLRQPCPPVRAAVEEVMPANGAAQTENGASAVEVDRLAGVSVATRAVHGGERAGRPRVSDSLTTPIVQTSTYTFRDTAELIAYQEGRFGSYEYGRYGNPTTRACEEKIRELEGAEDCLVSSSGMNAATTMLLALVPAGGHIVTTTDCYRRTRQFIQTVLPKMGISATVIDPADLGALERALEEHKVSLFFSESPTNPYMRCIDIPRIKQLCGPKGAAVVVDSTFATPINQQAIALGADLVIHSATKYLAGHNDVLAGAIAGKAELVAAVRAMHNVLGGTIDPHASYLLLRGMKTLDLRVQRQNATAMLIAARLEAHPLVTRVHYPGLASHPDHAIAVQQMSGYGGVVSFEIDGDLWRTAKFIDSVQLPYIAPSLGGVESLIEQPTVISYWDQGPEKRAQVGIKDNLIRFSCGIESAEDIWADFEQAFKKI